MRKSDLLQQALPRKVGHDDFCKESPGLLEYLPDSAPEHGPVFVYGGPFHLTRQSGWRGGCKAPALQVNQVRDREARCIPQAARLVRDSGDPGPRHERPCEAGALEVPRPALVPPLLSGAPASPLLVHWVTRSPCGEDLT